MYKYGDEKGIYSGQQKKKKKIMSSFSISEENK